MTLPTITLQIDTAVVPSNLRSFFIKLLRQVLKNVISKMVAFMKRIVPEDTGQLVQSGISEIRKSSITNQGLQVSYGFSAAHAVYVNQMVGVNWSKKSSQSQFYSKGLAYLRSILASEIQIVAQKLQKKQSEQDLQLLLIALESQLLAQRSVLALV